MTNPPAPDPVARDAPAPAARPGATGQLILLRLSGELSTKARPTRRQFVARLVRNLRDALAAEQLAGRVERRHDRLLVHEPGPGAAELLARVFGVQSVSVAERHPAPDLAAVVDRGEALFREAVRGRRFAVRARRVGSGAALHGREVEVALGARLLPHAARVDLDHPEVTARVELYGGDAYFFTGSHAGEAGLPLGSGDRAVALVSGGFDSPVAAWQMLRRGVDLDYVFCNLGGASHQLGTLRVMKVIADRWSYGSRPRLHALDFDAVSRDLRARCEPRYWQVLLKRLMLRAAERVAHEIGALAIVTGEAVGQVSSQTLVNLQAISDATRLPILRPLVGSNKDEIIARAERIGTAALSATVDEYCALVSRRPATAARLPVVLEQESRLDPAVLEHALATRRRIELRRVDPDADLDAALTTSRVPEGAVVIDLRTREQFRSWHWPGAVHLEFGQALEAFPSFSKEQQYVLYCEYGLKSVHLAEQMQALGLRALHVSGGTATLRRAAAAAEDAARRR